MYMKLFLLAESLLFSVLMLLGDDIVTQLTGGLVVSLLFFVITLFSMFFIGDGLRDALDPKDR
jgi:ABC-type dipeptide/oligopeptide/nickel transport system permease subunit